MIDVVIVHKTTLLYPQSKGKLVVFGWVGAQTQFPQNTLHFNYISLYIISSFQCPYGSRLNMSQTAWFVTKKKTKNNKPKAFMPLNLILVLHMLPDNPKPCITLFATSLIMLHETDGTTQWTSSPQPLPCKAEWCKTTSLQHAKMVYAKDIMHIHMQMNAANIYMAYMYMYARLGLGVYAPYTGIYCDIEACTQHGANIYIYTLESWCTRLNLACAAQYGNSKLWNKTLSFHIC